MTDQYPTNEPQPVPTSSPAERPHRGSPLVPGIILIVLGLAFLLGNMGILTFSLHNWWALFILIPAAAAFEKALRVYRSAGNRWTAPVRSSLYGGLMLTLVAVIFLAGLRWAIWGPILLILFGLSLAANALFARQEG